MKDIRFAVLVGKLMKALAPIHHPVICLTIPSVNPCPPQTFYWPEWATWRGDRRGTPRGRADPCPGPRVAAAVAVRHRRRGRQRCHGTAWRPLEQWEQRESRTRHYYSVSGLGVVVGVYGVRIGGGGRGEGYRSYADAQDRGGASATGGRRCPRAEAVFFCVGGGEWWCVGECECGGYVEVYRRYRSNHIGEKIGIGNQDFVGILFSIV